MRKTRSTRIQAGTWSSARLGVADTSDPGDHEQGMVSVPKQTNADARTVETVDDLACLAAAMEGEAAARYEALAADMDERRKPEVAALFRSLAAEEREHEREARRWLSSPDAEVPATAEWVLPLPEGEAGSETDFDPDLVTPTLALDFAIHNEERAFHLFVRIAATAADLTVREHAETLAKEELSHLSALRKMRARTRREERKLPTDSPPWQDPFAVDSKEAFLETTRSLEANLAHKWAGLARLLDEAGHVEASRFVGERALKAADLAGVTLSDRRLPEEEDPDLPAVKTPSDALVLLLQDADEAVKFYTAVAEKSMEEELVAEALRQAEDAVGRLQLVRATLAKSRTGTRE